MDSIKVCKRDFSANGSQLRRKGLTPGNVYGGSLEEPVSLQIETSLIDKLLRDKHKGSRCEIVLDGEDVQVQIKDVACNPVNGEVYNISFQALEKGQKVNSVIHVILENVDTVKATLEQMITEISYSAMPKDMIDTVTIDVAGQMEGTVVTVADIPELRNDKIELHVNSDEIVYRIVSARIVKEESTEEETAETDNESAAEK